MNRRDLVLGSMTAFYAGGRLYAAEALTGADLPAISRTGGQITLTSLHGSVLGNTNTGVFNDAPTVTATAGAVRLVVEGGVDTLNVNAGGNVNWVFGDAIVPDPIADLNAVTSNVSGRIDLRALRG